MTAIECECQACVIIAFDLKNRKDISSIARFKYDLHSKRINKQYPSKPMPAAAIEGLKHYKPVRFKGLILSKEELKQSDSRKKCPNPKNSAKCDGFAIGDNRLCFTCSLRNQSVSKSPRFKVAAHRHNSMKELDDEYKHLL